jgi:hypothetical protein
MWQEMSAGVVVGEGDACKGPAYPDTDRPEGWYTLA